MRERFVLADIINAEELAGYKKKSFVLPYNGGEIWFEHLDGIYEYETLVLNKLENDAASFSKPSAPSHVCFVFTETTVSEHISHAVIKAILDSGKRFTKIAFVGLDKTSKRTIKKELTGKGFGIGFLEGLEDAKEWLLKSYY